MLVQEAENIIISTFYRVADVGVPLSIILDGNSNVFCFLHWFKLLVVIKLLILDIDLDRLLDLD